MRVEAVSPGPYTLATASVATAAKGNAANGQRPRTNVRLRPVSARISERVRGGQSAEPSGPRFPIEAVMAWALAATAVYLSWLIAS